MLQLRPNCELCDRDLPATAKDAMICSYECTFCKDCVETTLHDVCPNCGGNFSPRPIRPGREHRPGTGLEAHPASTNRVHSSYTTGEIDKFVEQLAMARPEQR